MSAQATSDFRRRRKENLITLCGKKCALCGYDKVLAALEFHHIDPSKKSYGVASGGSCHDLEKDLAEVKKCILVCANCHREIHSGCYSQQELEEKQVFDESFAEFLRKDKYNRTMTKTYFCQECGKEITKYSESGLCSDCSHKVRRITERPNRSILKSKIRTMPFTQIGKEYGVSDNTIRKWCKAASLPSRVTDIKNYSDQEWEKI